MELSRKRRDYNWLNLKEEKYGQGQNRTADTRIFSPLLYRLSYLAVWVETGILPKCRGESRFRRLAGKRFDLFLDEIDHVAHEPHVIERVDPLNSRRAGDVDFGKKAADDIQADKI